MIKFLKQNWMVLLVGAYFALTSIYNAYGEARNVYWVIGIKTVKDLFIIALISAHIKRLPNILSMLFAFGGIAITSYLMIFRWLSAYVSEGDYNIYFDYMKSDNYSLLFTVIIFCTFTCIKFLNKK